MSLDGALTTLSGTKQRCQLVTEGDFSSELVRAIDQADSCRFATAVAQKRAQVGSFVVDEVALGKVSSEYFSFPCTLSFH